MTTFKNFQEYLQKTFAHKSADGNGFGITHTRMPNKAKGIYGGAYSIPNDKYEKVMKKYYKYVFEDGNDEYITEAQTATQWGLSPILLDLDFRYKTDVTERQHTKEHIIDIVMYYADELQNILDIPRDTKIDVYIMEREKPVFLLGDDVKDKTKEKVKDGVHIIFDLNIDVKIKIELRNRLLLRMKDFCDDMPLTNSWEDVIDKGIVEGGTNWTLIGSRKSENDQYTPYKVTQHLTLLFCVNNNEDDIEYKLHDEPFDMKEHFFKLSARNLNRPSFFIKGTTTEEENFKKVQEIYGRLVKKFQKKETIKPETIESETTEPNQSDNPVKIYCELGIKYKIWEKMSQGSNHKWWINVGILIKNEIGEEGEDIFVNLSRHDSKFVEEDVRNTYKLFGKSITSQEKKPLTIASLIKYFKDTDKELSKTIIKEAVKLIKKQEPKTEIEISEVELDETKKNHFDTKYMNSFIDDYATQKKYFELFVCKVMRPEPQYIYIENVSKNDYGKDALIYDESSIVKSFKHIKTNVIKGSGENTYIVESDFTAKWLNDKNIRVYNKIDFIPVNDIKVGEQTDETIFNLFTGYNPNIKSEYNKEKEKVILKPFFELGTQLCGGVENDSNYFLKYIAQMIQKPGEKIPICIIFKGKQGTGKSMFINAIGNLIGKEHFISSSKPKDFFGDYAEGFYHKLLVNMNECEGKDTFDFEGKIKSFISEDRITINPKNVRPSEINNLARVIISTNKSNPVPIDVKSGDRRYVVYQSTDFYLNKKYGSTYWGKLLEHFKKPEFIACLYNYFNTLDISQVDWRSERPITEAYKQMCKLYVPIEALFFESYTNEHRGCLIPLKDKVDVDNYQGNNWEVEMNPRNKDVYDDYVRFCKSAGFSNDKRTVVSIPTFNNRCEELEIPHRLIKSNGNNEFRYTPKDIYDYLLKKKWINRDAEDPEIVPIDDKGEDVEFEI